MNILLIPSLFLTMLFACFALLSGFLYWLMPIYISDIFVHPIMITGIFLFGVECFFCAYFLRRLLRQLRIYYVPDFRVHSRVLSFFLFIGILLLQETVQAQVSGTVFRDYNASGSRTTANPSEPGERGITITAYKPDGSTVVATTDASGNYSFTSVQIPSGTKVRLEFKRVLTIVHSGQAMVLVFNLCQHRLRVPILVFWMRLNTAKQTPTYTRLVM